jgi:hypothetical protein
LVNLTRNLPEDANETTPFPTREPEASAAIVHVKVATAKLTILSSKVSPIWVLGNEAVNAAAVGRVKVLFAAGVCVINPDKTCAVVSIALPDATVTAAGVAVRVTAEVEPSLVADGSRITCCLTVLVKTEAFEDIFFWV